MSKARYILSTDPISKDAQEKFVAILQAANLNWWHWLPNTWLIVDQSGNATTNGISDAFRMLAPNTKYLLLEYVTTGNFIGFGPSGTNEISTDMFYWLKTYWYSPHETVTRNLLF